MDKKTLFLKAAAIGVVLNIVLSYALSPFATDDEITNRILLSKTK